MTFKDLPDRNGSLRQVARLVEASQAALQVVYHCCFPYPAPKLRRPVPQNP
jgi:hypothetical protein